MTVTVEMVSDLVCPWCWLGLRRIRSAIALASDVQVDLLFRPYELDPTLPAEGTDYKAYMTSRLGGTGDAGESPQTSRFRAMREALEQYGEAENIPFDFSGIKVRPNTFDAHRLVRWAQGQGLGAAAKEALFTAYFRDHRDIGRREVLCDIADEIGLDGVIVGDLLDRNADRDAVRAEQQLFLDMGIRGVPTYVGDRRFAVQGAESAEKLAKFLRTLAAHQPTEHHTA